MESIEKLAQIRNELRRIESEIKEKERTILEKGMKLIDMLREISTIAHNLTKTLEVNHIELSEPILINYRDDVTRFFSILKRSSHVTVKSIKSVAFVGNGVELMYDDAWGRNSIVLISFDRVKNSKNLLLKFLLVSDVILQAVVLAVKELIDKASKYSEKLDKVLNVLNNIANAIEEALKKSRIMTAVKE